MAEGIATDVYFPPDGVPPVGTGAYAYGFPGSIGANAITEFFLSERKLAMMQPHYIGTYDSEGAASPRTAIDSLMKAVSVVMDSRATNIKNGEPLTIPTPVTTLVGHSFGCFAALRAATQLSSIRELILLGPAISFGDGPFGCGVQEDGPWQLAYVRRSRPFTYRLAADEEWLSMYRGDFNVPRNSSYSPALQRVVGMVGTDDKYFDLEILRDRFEQIVRRHLGTEIDVTLLVVEGAEHGAASLLDLGRRQLLSALGRPS